MQVTGLSPLYTLSLLIHITVLQSSCYDYPHFIDEELEAKEGKQIAQGHRLEKQQARTVCILLVFSNLKKLD